MSPSVEQPELRAVLKSMTENINDCQEIAGFKINWEKRNMVKHNLTYT